MSKLEVRFSHFARQCHPETCCCKTDYVVVDGGMVIEDVETEQDGLDFIEWLDGDE